jgi:hypothetical protein
MDIALALQHMRPGEEWTLNGDTYEGLTWLSKTKAPTEAEIEDAYPGIVAGIAAEQAKAEKQAAAAVNTIEKATGLTVAEIRAALGI